MRTTLFVCAAAASSRPSCPQVGGAAALVATLFGRVESSASRIGVVLTRGAAPRAIVPQVGGIVTCRSAPPPALLPLALPSPSQGDSRGASQGNSRHSRGRRPAHRCRFSGMPCGLCARSRCPPRPSHAAPPQAAIRLPDVDVRQKIDSLKMCPPLRFRRFSLHSRCCCRRSRHVIRHNCFRSGDIVRARVLSLGK